MANKLRKKYQRGLTKKIREINKAIEEDNLWLGRFVIRQIEAQWEKFEDGSGGMLLCVIRCIDKKTRQYKDYNFEYAPWMKTFTWGKIMDILNKFIVNDVDVWKNGDPRNEIQDWTKVPIPSSALEKTSWEWLANSLYCLQKY